jgi:hypothetical protein
MARPSSSVFLEPTGFRPLGARHEGESLFNSRSEAFRALVGFGVRLQGVAWDLSDRPGDPKSSEDDYPDLINLRPE